MIKDNLTAEDRSVLANIQYSNVFSDTEKHPKLLTYNLVSRVDHISPLLRFYKFRKMEDQDGLTQPAGAPPDPGGADRGSMESLLLSMLHWWSISGMEPNLVIDLLEKNFTQEQMITAHCSLLPGIHVPRKQVSNKRPAAKAQAEGLYTLVMKLNHENKMPRFTVSSEDLGRVTTMPSSLCLRDERSVSARMESLELTMRRLQDSIVTIAQQPPGRGSRGVQGNRVQPMNSNDVTPKIVINDAPNVEHVSTFAEAAAKAAGGQQHPPVLRYSRQPGGRQVPGLIVTPQGEVEVRGMSVSPSQKRGREEWHQVGDKNKSKKNVRKTEVGTSSVDFSGIEGAQAGPVQFYIGNTNARSSIETIKTVLARSAES